MARKSKSHRAGSVGNRSVDWYVSACINDFGFFNVLEAAGKQMRARGYGGPAITELETLIEKYDGKLSSLSKGKDKCHATKKK